MYPVLLDIIKLLDLIPQVSSVLTNCNLSQYMGTNFTMANLLLMLFVIYFSSLHWLFPKKCRLSINILSIYGFVSLIVIHWLFDN